MNINRKMIHDIIEAANERERTYHTFESKYYPDGHPLDFELDFSKKGKHIFRDKFSDTHEYEEMENAETALENLVNAYDFDTIKEIQTLMYIGRDSDGSEETPKEELFEYYFKCFNQRGWNDKEIEADQITEKVPLGTYLKKGLDKIGM